VSKPKILYLRNDTSLDELLKEAADEANEANEANDVELILKTIDFLDSDELRKDRFDIIILRDESCDKLFNFLDTRPSDVPTIIMQLRPEGTERLECYHSKNYWFEQIRECMVRNVLCVSETLKKNLFLLRNQTDERKILVEIMNLMPDGIAIWDSNGKLIETNSRITGIPKRELAKRNGVDFLREMTEFKTKESFDKAIGREKTVRFEANIRKHDGSLMPTEVNTRLIKSDSGEPLYYLSILTDITPKIREWEKEQYLNHLMKHSPHAIFALDVEDRVIMWNQGAEETLGFEVDETLGKKIYSILPKNLCKEYQEVISSVKNEGNVLNKVLNWQKKDGQTIQVEAFLEELIDKNGNHMGISGNFRDITKIQQHLLEIKKKNEEMEHLINMVSHDMRNPIHSMANYLSFIKESIRDIVVDENVFEMIERAQANLSNMESMIKDLTDFSRASLDSDDEMAVDLNSIIDEIISNLQWQIGHRKLNIKVQKLPVIRINPHKIYQIFQNLITNAYKFRKDDEIATAEIESRIESYWIHFSIRDFGIGISPKHKEKIFNLFFRAKEKNVEGSGAGLAITRKIIETYGGRIWVESTPGEGSVFHFTLPITMKVKEENRAKECKPVI
jgi:PAS domain S-box-containing protein